MALRIAVDGRVLAYGGSNRWGNHREASLRSGMPATHHVRSVSGLESENISVITWPVRCRWLP